jgi:hypothetical protein
LIPIVIKKGILLSAVALLALTCATLLIINALDPAAFQR